MWLPPQPKIEFPPGTGDLRRALHQRFGEAVREDGAAADMPTLWTDGETAPALLAFLKQEAPQPFRRLEDLTAIDERARRKRPDHDFTLVYHLTSFDEPGYLRVKVPLTGEDPRGAHRHRRLPERQLVRAGGLRHVRHRLCRPSQPAAHPDARLLGRPPAAQGASLPGDGDAGLYRRNRRFHPAAGRRRLLQAAPNGSTPRR